MKDDAHAFDLLKADQLAAARARPLPRRVLGRGTLALLVALRVYVLVAIPIVAYAFVNALTSSGH